MSNARPKEPLIGVLLTALLPGLGHAYAGNIRRALLHFSVVGIVLPAAVLSYVLHPATRLSMALLLGAGSLAVSCMVYVLVDAYRSVTAWNVQHGLKRETTRRKKMVLVAAILIVMLGLNPVGAVAGFLFAQIVIVTAAQAFQVEQYSMEPTLTRGDRVLVDKLSYRRAGPERGDIVVLRYPRDLRRAYIKRVVGLPGETVEVTHGRLLVSGTPLRADGAWSTLPCYSSDSAAPGGISVRVPPAQYFVLGDNCNNSEDSRAFGPVPLENLIGKAYKIYYPFHRSGPIQ